VRATNPSCRVVNRSKDDMVAVSRQPEFGSLHFVVTSLLHVGLEHTVHDKDQMLLSNQREKETSLYYKS
jgi:hypothetical protein